MVEARWLRWIGPGLVALGAVGLIASTTVGAGARPWAPRGCAGPTTDRIEAARDSGPAALADLRAAPWFRQDAVAGDDGALRGQRLVVGRHGDSVTRSLDLPPESFAAGPFGRVVLVGSDDGTTSRLEALDVANGCSWTLGTERAAVIRRATLDAAGKSVYETRVDRSSRTDLGIWRRPVDGSSPAVRVLGPIAPDDRFGRTWSTEFLWDLAGSNLAIQSCGEVACRTRILAPDGGQTRTLDDPDLGLLVGVDGDHVVTYAACRGLPCPIMSTDIATGTHRVLSKAAAGATLVATPAGTRLVHETHAAAGAELRSVPLDGSPATDLGSLPGDDRLGQGPFSSGSATRLPSGWVLLAPDGRLPVDRSDHRPKLRHVPDGTTVPLDEATR